MNFLTMHLGCIENNVNLFWWVLFRKEYKHKNKLGYNIHKDLLTTNDNESTTVNNILINSNYLNAFNMFLYLDKFNIINLDHRINFQLI